MPCSTAPSDKVMSHKLWLDLSKANDSTDFLTQPESFGFLGFTHSRFNDFDLSLKFTSQLENFSFAIWLNRFKMGLISPCQNSSEASGFPWNVKTIESPLRLTVNTATRWSLRISTWSNLTRDPKIFNESIWRKQYNLYII